MEISSRSATTKVVVATTVMLSFISFWRAAAIVLSDLASSAYYVGGISERAIGKSAPWFVLAIMLFSYAVRAVYIESCSMFVRGGVYKVVSEAMGSTLAKFSVSALMFDYVLTGPISGVSAGLYLAGLINEIGDMFHVPSMHVHAEYFAAVFAILVTFYFWRQNVRGIHESSLKALRIMQITTVMVVILITWCVVTIMQRGFFAVPLPTPQNIHFGEGALGWLKGTVAPSVTLIAVLVGLGHSLLAMSGEESLAQVNREIAHPKLKNLERAGLVIFIYSLLFTSLVSFFAVMIIPDSDRPQYLDNLIGGLAMYLVGPLPVRLIFHGFVVLVGTLILSGAVNTAIIGSNGVLNRVAEDGVLTDWFRHPHPKFGTSHRIINLIVIMQVATIAISRGDMFLLGEAYAFGVVWSFSMNALAMLRLRSVRPEGRGWKVPLNLRVGNKELPVGLALITAMLFTLASVNVLTKKTATIAGITFTGAFFVMFEVSERYNKRRKLGTSEKFEKFRLDQSEEIAPTTLNVRPGNVIVAVRNPHRLDHLAKVLEKTDTSKIDIVVLTVRLLEPSAEYSLDVDQLFSEREAEVFSKVVSLAEKAGRHVELLVASGTDPSVVGVQTAQKLQSARIVAGCSAVYDAAEQGRIVGEAWEQLPEPRPPLSLEIVLPDGRSAYFNLGPHPPRLWPEDVSLVHELWLDLSGRIRSGKLHHRDVVGLALKRLRADLQAGDRDALIDQLGSEIGVRQWSHDLELSGTGDSDGEKTRAEVKIH